jgi:acyl carrier protein
MDSQELFERFLVIAKRHARTNLDAVSRASLVTELGLDSLVLAEAISDLEQELDITIPDEDLLGLYTLGEFVDRVAVLVSTREASNREASNRDE